MRTHGDFFRHIYAESNETQRVLVEDRYAHTTEALLGCTKNTHSPNIMNDGFQGPYLVYIDVDTLLFLSIRRTSLSMSPFISHEMKSSMPLGREVPPYRNHAIPSSLVAQC